MVLLILNFKKIFEEKTFFKYNKFDKININDFFNDNYDILRKDNIIRRKFVESYIKGLSRQMLRKI